MTVRTRFAPSPTGFLHIGGVRTALFNWLFARHHGGQFVLRIDDTDQARHQEDTVAPIIEGFDWLGLDYDEGPKVGGPHAPYFQSERGDIYRDWCDRLLASGAFYKDYTSEQDRADDRLQADRDKRPYRFRRREYPASQIAFFEGSKRPYCIRLAVPTGRILTLEDSVRGKVEWNTDDIGDFVVMRGDGSPLYSFATVVDDALMSISHVIRSEEHLPNTFPQLLVYEAMGFAPPQFAHLPYVAAPGSKKKMSKRDGGAGLHEYQADYLPDAMINYLAKLGWSLDDHTEFMTRKQLIDNFSLERVVHAAASHDSNKLYWLQGEWMKQTDMLAKMEGAALALIAAGLVTQPISPEDLTHLSNVICALGDRMKVFSDIIKYGGFFFKPKVEYDPDAVEKRITKPPGVASILASCCQMFANADPAPSDEQLIAAPESVPVTAWTASNLERWVHDYAEGAGHKMGVVVNAVRVAVTGQAVGPGLYDTLIIIGQKETVRRINHSLKEFFRE